MAEAEATIGTKPAVSPLIGSAEVEILEEIETDFLVDIWQRDFGIDVSGEFAGIRHVRLCRCPDSDLKFFDPPVVGSHAFQGLLHDKDWYAPAEKFEFDHAAKWIGEKDRVLDIGCGSGGFAARVPQADYTGLESNKVARNKAQVRGIVAHSEPLAEHAEARAGRYDAVCAFQVLEHVADPLAFTKAAVACLRPGGLLILGLPSAESYIASIVNFALNAPPHHVTWWSDNALRCLADRIALDVVEIEHAPVEDWERRLYSFARLQPKSEQLFVDDLAIRRRTIFAWLASAVTSHLAPPLPTANGASVIVVMRKPVAASEPAS